MPKPKKEINKDIAEVVKYFYETYKDTKPDATHYKQGHAILDELMHDDNSGKRVYNYTEIKAAIDGLYHNNVAISSLAILRWPDVLRAFADDDKQTQKIIIKSMLARQEKDGLVGYKTLNAEPPRGW